MDVTRLLVKTKHLKSLYEKIDVQINGFVFNLKIMEDPQWPLWIHMTELVQSDDSSFESDMELSESKRDDDEGLENVKDSFSSPDGSKNLEKDSDNH